MRTVGLKPKTKETETETSAPTKDVKNQSAQKEKNK